jgi:hypothetical protein
MKRTIGGAAVFGVMIVFLLGMLQLVSWIPSAIEDGAFRAFRSIDEVRAHLPIDPIYQPVYYPRSVQWPPNLIAAQSHPYPAVVMEFQSSEERETVLTITQTALTHPPLVEKIRMSTVRASATFPLKGRPAVLESGICRGNTQCSRLTWDDGVYRLSLVMMDAPVELVRIAESMVLERKTGTDPGPSR